MKTEGILMQDLLVPCACRCRYCLLDWDGRTAGVPWERGLRFARRFRDRLREERPELRFSFAFGCSMEHPRLPEALRALRELGSPQAEFLQCDGMRMRSEAECRELAGMLAAEGVRQLNFTFYGLPEYHDAFAGRPGDFELLLRMLRAAAEAGLSVSAGIPLTGESAPQADPLMALLRPYGPVLSLFVPHEEGRGISLQDIRFSLEDLERLSPEARARFSRELYRPEGEWVRSRAFSEETRRMLLLTLRRDCMDRYEGMSPAALIAEAEALDEAYYAAFPGLPELAERYGDPEGRRFYRQRDLFYHYRRLYAAEHGISVYDVTDERQTGSRRS